MHLRLKIVKKQGTVFILLLNRILAFLARKPRLRRVAIAMIPSKILARVKKRQRAEFIEEADLYRFIGDNGYVDLQTVRILQLLELEKSHAYHD